MNFLKIKSDNDKLFRNSDFKDMFSETVSEFNLKPAERHSKFLVAENIVSMTTIECILENEVINNYVPDNIKVIFAVPS